MRRDELLALQERVIHALSGEDPAGGIDPTRVDLVRDLARAKRIAKIESVLPRTCRAFGEGFRGLSVEFVRAVPPTSFRSRADALGFYRFLARRHAAPGLRDLAYCELALSALRTGSSGGHPALRSSEPGSLAIRRAPGVRLRTCQFDVRPFFEDGATGSAATVQRSPVHLAILADPLAGTPRIVQLHPGVFDFLRAARGWRVLPEGADDETKQLFRELQQRGLLEIAHGRE